MIAIVHSIYSQSVHAPARDAGLMDNDAERYCICISMALFKVKSLSLNKRARILESLIPITMRSLTNSSLSAPYSHVLGLAFSIHSQIDQSCFQNAE